MEFSNFDLQTLAFCFLISILLHIVFARRYIYHILDPWVVMFLSQSVILTFAFYSITMKLMSIDHFCYIIFSWLSFIIGLSIFYKKDPVKFQKNDILGKNSTRLALKFYLYVFLVNSCLIFYFVGIPFFTGNRTLLVSFSKLGHYFGILSYINWGVQSIIELLGLKIWLIDGKKRFGLLALSSIVLFNILNGGTRTGYLNILLLIGLGFYYLKRNYNIPFKMPAFMKWAFILLPFFILAAFTNTVKEGYEKNVLLSFLRRFLGEAEGPYFYFVKHSFRYFTGLNLFSYHFSQILPYFGYTDKEITNLGVNLTLYSDLHFGTPGYGPTPTMYVIGHIALGNFGVIYCFLIGVFLSYLRYKFKASFLIWICFNLWATTLLADGTLMALNFFYILLLSPIIIISIILINLAVSYQSVARTTST